jgi:hypothetical protein
MLFVGIARCLQPSDLKSTAQIRFDLGQPGVYRSTSPFHRHFAVRPLGFVDSKFDPPAVYRFLRSGPSFMF